MQKHENIDALFKSKSGYAEHMSSVTGDIILVKKHADKFCFFHRYTRLEPFHTTSEKFSMTDIEEKHKIYKQKLTKSGEILQTI